MRVGILTQYFPPEMGAAPTRLSELARRLRERGHEVHVLTSMPSYPLGKVYPGYGGVWRREDVDGVDVMRAWSRPSLSTRIVPRTLSYLSFAASSALFGALRLPRLDVLVTESPPLPLGPSGYLLSRLRRARFVLNVSDLWPESAVLLGVLDPDGRTTRLAYRLESFCYRRAWRVSGQSREIRENIELRYPGVRTISLPGGVDTELFDPRRRDERLRLRLFGDTPVVAVYAGLHGIAQGLDQIVEAALRLRARRDLTFAFVGAGPVKAELVERARQLDLDNVRFVDVQPRDSMPAVLASADIAVVPLRLRLPGAVPSKLYEAMASAVPVVLVAGGEPAEILEAAGGGVVVAPDDVESLTDAVARLADDARARARLGAAGRAAAVAGHDRWAACDRFIDALEGLA
jgi:glycosyltransferase involved in cell wall biosynthesis